MTAEEAALIMMSGGGNSYTNERKDITANGEYEPDEGVRWDRVIVNVPDYKDEMEKYKKLYELATDRTDPSDIETNIPRDPNDPDNPNGDDRWIFENAIDIGENIDPNDFLPLLLKAGKTSGNIVDINSGLSVSYQSGSNPASITITNLYNGEKYTREVRTDFDDPGYVDISKISVLGYMVYGLAGDGHSGQSMYLYYDSIDFSPPADWKPYYIVV